MFGNTVQDGNLVFNNSTVESVFLLLTKMTLKYRKGYGSIDYLILVLERF